LTGPGRLGGAGNKEPIRAALDVLPLAGHQAGVGAFTAHLAEALLQNDDVSLTMYAVGRRAAAVQEHVPKGAVLRTRSLPARLVNLAWQYTSVPSVERLTGPVEVVHGTNYVVPPTRRAASVVTVHDLTALRFPALCAPASLTYPALVGKAISRGAFVHTPSRFVAEEVIEMLDAEPERVRVIPHGLPAVDDRGGDESPVPPPYVLAVGTVEPRKDYPTLVTAFDELAAGQPELRLVIAGADGWGTKALETVLAGLRFKDRVIRLGYVDGPTRGRLLRHACVLAYPSVYEGFGLPPLEAMAAGIPVVASDGGAIPEVVGDAALVVPAGDATALAMALRKVMDEPSLREGLIRRGQELVVGRPWSAAAVEMVRLYRDAWASR
jgi:glycosyltransferase involved in cell wall biosynthesis